ncbi:MAG: LytTR family DNA-binding domain-containing protein [Ruegeria sp.]
MKSKIGTFLRKLGAQKILCGFILVFLLTAFVPPILDAGLSYGSRLVFWVCVFCLAAIVTWVTTKAVQSTFTGESKVHRDIAAAVVTICAFTPSLWAMAWLVFTLEGKDPPGFVTVAPYGVLFALLLVLVRPAQPRTVQDEGSDEPEPRLRNRLPATFQGEIYRLSADDHNVEVATSEGVFSLRMRLTDAIAEMEPIAGYCTHRSHWVTENAVCEVVKAGGKISLRLANGDLVPVSRKYKPNLVDLGVL